MPRSHACLVPRDCCEDTFLMIPSNVYRKRGIPPFETAAINGGGYLASILFMCGMACTKASAISWPEKLPDVKINDAVPARKRLTTSRWLCASFLSFVKITHPLLPTTGSQSVSLVSGAKWSVFNSTFTPQARRASGTTCRPRHLSIKNVGSRRVLETEFASEPLFDFEPRASIIVSQAVYGISGLVSFCDNCGFNAAHT